MASMRLGGLATGMDTDAIVKQLVQARRTKLNGFTQSKTKTEWKQEAYQNMNKDIATFIVEARKKLGLNDSVTYNGKLRPNSVDKLEWAKKAEVTGDSFTATAGSNAPDMSMSVKVKQLASGASVTGNTTTTKASDVVNANADTTLALTVGKEVKNVTIKAGTTYDAALKQIKAETGLDISFGKVGKNASGADTSMLFMSSKKTGSDQSIKSSDAATQAFFEKLGVASADLAKGFSGKDSVVSVNGKDITNSTNLVDINGIRLSLKKADAENAPANTVTVKADVDGIYNKIKEFVDGYNKIITSMQDKVKEASYRKYQPLLSEERKALSEEEVKLWDEKAKSGLLKGDNALTSTISNVRLGLYEKVDGAGFMSDLGITTGNYKEGAVLKIDEKKLKEAISKDPQKVMDTLFKTPDDIKSYPKNSPEAKAQRANTGVFLRVMEDMGDGINAIAKQSGVGKESSIVQQVRGNILSGIIKNNSIAEKDIVSFTKRIDEENDRISAYETALYKKFAAMEAAIQKMQSQTSWMQQQ